MLFVLVGEVIKKEFRNSRNGNEYVMFSILDSDSKEFDLIGFSSVAKTLKDLPDHSKVVVEGKVDSEPKTTSNGGRFLNYKLISEKVSIINFTNSVKEDVNQSQNIPVNFEQIDNENIPF